MLTRRTRAAREGLTYCTGGTRRLMALLTQSYRTMINVTLCGLSARRLVASHQSQSRAASYTGCQFGGIILNALLIQKARATNRGLWPTASLGGIYLHSLMQRRHTPMPTPTRNIRRVIGIPFPCPKASLMRKPECCTKSR